MCLGQVTYRRIYFQALKRLRIATPDFPTIIIYETMRKYEKKNHTFRLLFIFTNPRYSLSKIRFWKVFLQLFKIQEVLKIYHFVEVIFLLETCATVVHYVNNYVDICIPLKIMQKIVLPETLITKFL